MQVTPEPEAKTTKKSKGKVATKRETVDENEEGENVEESTYKKRKKVERSLTTFFIKKKKFFHPSKRKKD
jgi:hypothetical protein